MKDDKIRYLKGNKVLLGLADEEFEDFLSYQSVLSFSKPKKFKNRYRKSWSEGETDRLKRPRFSSIKNWSNEN